MLSIFSNDCDTYEHKLISVYWTPIFDQIQDIVLILDEQLKIVQGNQSWQHFCQSDCQNLQDCLYPEDLYALIKEMHTQTGQYVQIRIINVSQALAWFEISLQRIDANQSTYWCMIARERTEYVNACEIKDAQQRMLKGVLHRLPIMLYRSRNNRDWSMEYVSEGCESITGYKENALINTPLYGQLIYPEDREHVWRNIQEALAAHTCFHIRYRLIKQNKNMHWVQEIGQGVYSDSDMVLGIDGVVFKTQSEIDL